MYLSYEMCYINTFDLAKNIILNITNLKFCKRGKHEICYNPMIRYYKEICFSYYSVFGGSNDSYK